MKYDLKMFNTGQVTIPKKWRNQFQTARFTATETSGWLLIKPVLEKQYDEKVVAHNLATLLEVDEGKLLTVQLSHDPSDPSVLYKTEAGYGIYFPDGMSATEMLQTLNTHIKK